MYFENANILRLNVFKYKIHLKLFEIQNSILYFKYVFSILVLSLGQIELDISDCGI